MKMKYLIIFLGIVLCLLQPKKSVAQHCISFDYDVKGNCVERMFYDGCDKNDDENIADFVETGHVENISLYPNPTDGFMLLSVMECCDEESSSYGIYDINGVLLKTGSVCSKTTLDIGDFLPGTYLVVVVVDGVSYSHTIVKL